VVGRGEKQDIGIAASETRTAKPLLFAAPKRISNHRHRVSEVVRFSAPLDQQNGSRNPVVLQLDHAADRILQPHP